MSDELPEGWTAAKVKEVGRVQLGRQRSPALHQGSQMRPYLRVANVFENEIRLDSVMEMQFDDADFRRFELRPGDVLLNEGQSPQFLGRPAIYRGEPPGACFTNSLIRFQASEAVDARFALLLFRHWMRSGEFQKRSQITTNIAHLSAGRFADMDFPVAPLPEQRRIVEKVEALLEQVGRAKGRLERVPVILKRFRRAVLAAACAGELTKEWRESRNLPQWTPVTMGKVCRFITDGDHQAPPTASSGIPFVTISEINGGVLRIADATRFVPANYFNALKPERRPARGDILFSVTGSIGIAALVETDERFVFQRHIAILKPNTDRLLSRFLRYRLEAHDIKAQGEEVATGTAQLTIPLGGLRAFSFDLPDLEEQGEIVRQLDQLFVLGATVEGRVQAAAACADKLPQTILSKAFSGELVPTEAHLARAEGRTYETAEVLLERVRRDGVTGDGPAKSGVARGNPGRRKKTG